MLLSVQQTILDTAMSGLWHRYLTLHPHHPALSCHETLGSRTFTLVLLTSLSAQMGLGLVQVAPKGLGPSLLRSLGPEGTEVANEMGGTEMSRR